MKIIERKPPETKWWIGKEFECLDCGTLVQIEPDDYPTMQHAYGGWWAVFMCPKCLKDRIRIKAV